MKMEEDFESKAIPIEKSLESIKSNVAVLGRENSKRYKYALDYISRSLRMNRLDTQIDIRVEEAQIERTFQNSFDKKFFWSCITM